MSHHTSNSIPAVYPSCNQNSKITTHASIFCLDQRPIGTEILLCSLHQWVSLVKVYIKDYKLQMQNNEML